MKKLLTATFIGVLVLSFLAMPAGSAQAAGSKIFHCDQMIVSGLSSAADWVGNLTGCKIAGEVYYWETDQNYVVGGTEHFFETFLITTATGTISGVEMGIWNFSTFKFRAEGWVTAADGEWAYLVGYKFHEMGTTTDPFDPNALAVYGPSTMFLAP